MANLLASAALVAVVLSACAGRTPAGTTAPEATAPGPTLPGRILVFGGPQAEALASALAGALGGAADVVDAAHPDLWSIPPETGFDWPGWLAAAVSREGPDLIVVHSSLAPVDPEDCYADVDSVTAVSFTACVKDTYRPEAEAFADAVQEAAGGVPVVWVGETPYWARPRSDDPVERLSAYNGSYFQILSAEVEADIAEDRGWKHLDPLGVFGRWYDPAGGLLAAKALNLHYAPRTCPGGAAKLVEALLPLVADGFSPDPGWEQGNWASEPVWSKASPVGEGCGGLRPGA